MTAREINTLFPLLNMQFEVTSPTDEEYNCIAWSVNDKRQWWWPVPPGRWPGKYWPPGVPNEETLKAFTAVYTMLGFEICLNRAFEDGYDKIAIYVDQSGSVTHAARWWLEDNGWSSKLGEENDIRHHSLEALEGGFYGVAVQIMRRQRQNILRTDK